MNDTGGTVKTEKQIYWIWCQWKDGTWHLMEGPYMGYEAALDRVHAFQDGTAFGLRAADGTPILLPTEQPMEIR